MSSENVKYCPLMLSHVQMKPSVNTKVTRRRTKVRILQLVCALSVIYILVLAYTYQFLSQVHFRMPRLARR